MGAMGTVAKLAVAANPIALTGVFLGLSGVALRQLLTFLNQRNRYMVVMARNLYFHSMADNRGVVALLADRAAEEDIKEELLLYSVLARRKVNARELQAIDQEIEGYLAKTFGIEVNFDIEDALKRLRQDGVVTELADGTLQALPPREAALHIDELWDNCLDQLPDVVTSEGREGDTQQGR